MNSVNKNVTSLIESKLYQLSQRFDKITDETDKANELALKGILKALDARDEYSFAHCRRVCFYSLLVGLDLNIPDRELYELQLTALFHDIGKIAMPDAILNKATHLNDTEFRMMQSHPQKSFEILDAFENLSQVATASLHHHERFDGRGYPDKLSGENIPLASRIIAVCDTFDSMTSNRAYRNAFPIEIVMNELKEFAGTQFDSDIVESFFRIHKTLGNEELDFYVPMLDTEANTIRKAA